MTASFNCPACSHQLTPLLAGGFPVEICKGGCGGVWLDGGELARLDDESDFVPEILLHTEKNKQVVVDQSKPRKCPKCVNQLLTPHYYDSQYEVEIDHCLNCDGIWLDLSELAQIRDQNKVSKLRQQVVDNYTEQFRDKLDGGGVPERMAAVFKLLF